MFVNAVAGTGQSSPEAFVGVVAYLFVKIC
jgi:hypothetical protein